MTIEEGSGGRRRYNPNEEEKEGTTRARNWLIYICQLPWLDEEKKKSEKEIHRHASGREPKRRGERRGVGRTGRHPAGDDDSRHGYSPEAVSFGSAWSVPTIGRADRK